MGDAKHKKFIIDKTLLDLGLNKSIMEQIAETKLHTEFRKNDTVDYIAENKQILREKDSIEQKRL